jgi:hypothetical protein
MVADVDELFDGTPSEGRGEVLVWLAWFGLVWFGLV